MDLDSNSEGKQLVIAVAGTVLAFLVLVVLVATIGGGLRSYERSEIMRAVIIKEK